MLDGLTGRARVSCGISGSTPYVQFLCPGVYSVLIRGDDWRKIFPLVRYGSGYFEPVNPPDTPPADILSPQPNRTMRPPPVTPGVGFTSFLQFFTWREYVQIQRLLTVNNLGSEPAAFQQSQGAPGPVWLDPPPLRLDQLAMRDVYGRLVGLLQYLFPTKIPTSYV